MRVRYNLIAYADESRIVKYRKAMTLYCRNSAIIILIFSVIAIITLYLTGIVTYLFEEDFSNYLYPLKSINVKELVEKIDRIESLQESQNILLENRTLDIDFINQALKTIQIEDTRYNVVTPLDQFKNLEFLLDISPTCHKQWGSGQIKNTILAESSQQNLISVIIVVKSAVNNYAHRNAIRKSWYLNQTLDLFTFKTVFMVGKCKDLKTAPHTEFKLNLESSWSTSDCNENIIKESVAYGDIVQSSGIDAYYNNTIKTYMTLRWLNEHCPADLTLAIDDDYVFEVENLVGFLHQQASEYLSTGSVNESNSTEHDRKLIALRRLLRQYFWAGYLRNYVHPIRSVLSKWYISRDDYAFNKYPPFITGGAVLMSFKTIKHLYYASYFTQAFKFDDVYVGILAYRLGLNPLHSDNFMCTLSDYLDANPIQPNSTSCMGVHDIDPQKLIELWQARKQDR